MSLISAWGRSRSSTSSASAVDPATATNPDSYKFRSFTYIYHSTYGSPEVDEETPKLLRADVGADRKTVRLTLAGLREGHVHELHLDGLRSAEGVPLLHADAYYTLNAIPPAEAP